MNDQAFDLLTAQRRVWMSGLGHTAKMVALALLDHWSKRSPEPDPSVARLGQWTSLGRCAVMRALGELRAAGAITSTDVKGKRNQYSLLPLMGLPVAEGDRSSRETSLGEMRNRSSRETGPVSEEDTKEPRKEPKKEPTGIGARDGSPTKEAKPKRTRAKAVEVALPADWTPTDAHRAFAAEHGLALELEAVAFKGHYEGRTAVSWNGRFATWLANQAKWNRERGPRKAPPPQRGVIDETKAQSWGKAGAADLLGGGE